MLYREIFTIPYGYVNRIPEELMNTGFGLLRLYLRIGKILGVL